MTSLMQKRRVMCCECCVQNQEPIPMITDEELHAYVDRLYAVFGHRKGGEG
jgi:hypothetical protein